MQKQLIVAGLVLLAVGLLWPWLAKLHLGRLPGDLLVERAGFKLYIPFTSMVAVSALLSLAIWLLRK